MAIRMAALGPQNRSNNLGAQPVFESFIYVDTQNAPVGSPLAFISNGAQDGMAVCLPSSLNAFGLGINLAGLVSASPTQLGGNGVVDVVIHGLHQAARINLVSRSATNATFASWSGINPGDAFAVDNVNNAIQKTTGAGAGLIIGAGVLASGSGGASNYTGGTQSATGTGLTNINGVMTTSIMTVNYNINVSPNGLFLYALSKVFVRMM